MRMDFRQAVSLILALALVVTGVACAAVPAAAPAASAAPQDAGDQSLKLVKDAGQLIIGLDDTFAPMGFRDEKGDLVGFDIDLATEVCAVLGVKPVFQPIDWDAKELELNGNKIDCIWNGMSITPARQESMSLTRGYLNNRIIVMTAPGVTVSKKDDLIGLKLGTQAKSSALEVVQADALYEKIKDNVSEYRTYDEVILDMQAGRIDAMIVDEVLGQYKNAKMGGVFGVAGEHFGDDLYAVGLRKGDAALSKALQDAIDQTITSGKAAEVSKKWFGQDIVLKK